MQSEKELYEFAKGLREKHLGFKLIHEKLTEKTSDLQLIESVMKQIKKEHFALKRKSGLNKLAISLVFMLTGFLITCFNFHANQSFTVVMYGLTGIGLVFLMWGLYELVG